MHIKTLLCSLMIAGSQTVMADSSTPATYIMQVSSNLGCDSLNIEFVSNANDAIKTMNFSKGAFAAVQLDSGSHEFGNVICARDGKIETLDLLKGKVSSLRVEPGHTYYGGRLIIKSSVEVDQIGAPKVLDDCTRNISRARGDEDDECRNGVGVSTGKNTAKKIEIFMPVVEEKDVDKVRTALSATKEQLTYLPLKAKA
jgi:hypothetical protein